MSAGGWSVPALAAVVVPALVSAGAGVVRAVGARYRRLRVRNRMVARHPSAGRGARAPRERVGRRAPRWFVRRIEAMAIGGDALVWWRRVWGGAVVLVVAVALAAGPVVALVAVVVGLAVAAMAADLNRDRADRLVDAGLPALLDRVAAGLRAGLSLPVALRDGTPVEPGPLRRDLLALAAALDAGVPLERCLTAWRARRPTPGTRLVTAAVALCARLGGRSRPLDGVASTLRDQLVVDREVRAVSAEARASAVVLVVAPWVFVAFSGARDPEVLGFFVDSPVGLACLAAGISLDLCGAWLMARTIRAVA